MAGTTRSGLCLVAGALTCGLLLAAGPGAAAQETARATAGQRLTRPEQARHGGP